VKLRLSTTRPCTEAEGPGKRYALWVQGCPIQCPGCCNPEMFAEEGGRDALVSEVLAEVMAQDVEGVTFLGGEPFTQAAALAELAKGVQAQGRTVMVFTGYVLEQLKKRQDPAVDALLAATDVLVDGPFVEGRPEPKRRWLGSDNQRYHFLTSAYALADPRFWADNTVEIHFDGRQILVNGWPYEL
jgi:anaerobic ribonucleoside-triphosphate reductase activating protein